jgi:hypothetical protein
MPTEGAILIKAWKIETASGKEYDQDGMDKRRHTYIPVFENYYPPKRRSVVSLTNCSSLSFLLSHMTQERAHRLLRVRDYCAQ